MKAIIRLVVVSQCILLSLCVSVGRGQFGEVQVFLAPAAYAAESAVALNDFSRKDKEVGYQLRSTLHVRPLWTAQDHTEFFLQFNLIKPKLYLRGSSVSADFRQFDSIWDSYQDTEFYVHWKSGVIQMAYLDTNEPVDVLNYKKSLISLFQFQIIDGEYKETDVSGTCDVLYDSISTDVFRKIKRSCVVGEASSAWDASVSVSVRRSTRYSLGAAPHALREVAADEVVQLGLAGAGVKARSWARLRLAPAALRPVRLHADLAAAVAALPPTFVPADLALALAGDDADEDDLSLEEALKESREALQAEEPGAGGGVADARAALRLLPALRAADQPALLALLHAGGNYPALTGLCRMLGLAGTRAAHGAADAFLHLGARDPLQPHAQVYLAAFALAAEPCRRAIAAVAELAEEARTPLVRDAALLAATAAAARLGGDDPARTLRDVVARSLSRCKEDACRAVRLRALGHLRREDAAELLLEHVESGGRAAALAAVEALAALPAAALHVGRRNRLERVALRGGLALEVRAAALDLFVRRSAAKPLALAETAWRLQRFGPMELRRLFWQRLHAFADADDEARRVVRMLPRQMTTWNALAHAGTSMALERPTGWRAGPWAARLDSLQVAAGGLLRRGLVRLSALAPDNSTHDLLAVEVWTRGMEALAGGAGDASLDEGDASDEGAAGGLGVAVGGVGMPPVELFSSSAELLGHVWAGTGSAPTGVVRALLPLGVVSAPLPLQSGVVSRARLHSALALALDAHAAASLWARTASAGLRLRAAAALDASLALRTAWGRASTSLRAEAAPRLRIAADLDFYDATALCVRVALDDYDERRFSYQESALGSRPLVVRRWLNATATLPGRSLSLGRAPDRACRDLRPADDDDD